MRAARLGRWAAAAAVAAPLALAAPPAWAAAPQAERRGEPNRPEPAAPRAAAPAAAEPAAEPAVGVAVEGSDTARLAVPPELAAALDGWSNAGYRVRRSGEGEVTVEVRLEPLRSDAPFPPADAAPSPASAETAPGDGGLAALAAEITRDATTRHQAVSSVLGWLVRNVAAGVDSSRSVTAAPDQATGEPSPAEVLERRAGDPPAVARLAVALLGSAGIEARVVRGLVAAAPDAAGPRGPHAWIEVVYPDRGGVFSDPLHTHHYVPATYLPLPPAAEPASAAEPPGVTPPAVTLVERTDRRLTVDVYPAGRPGITARKNRERQEAGALRVVVASDPRGSAVLAGQGSRRARELVRGESVFVGLAGGSYTLEVFLEGREPTRREVVVAPRERSTVYLPAGGPATAVSAPDGAGGPPAGPRKQATGGGHTAVRRPRP